jgi:hypothetical protein
MSLAKTEYKRTDPLEVTVSLAHRGKQPVWVNTRFFLGPETEPRREVFLEITAPNGEKLACQSSYKTGLPRTEQFRLLKPGETATAEHPLDLRNYFDFTALGTYTIVGVYQNPFGQEIGLDAFAGPVESEPVSITIVE